MNSHYLKKYYIFIAKNLEKKFLYYKFAVKQIIMRADISNNFGWWQSCELKHS